MDLEQQMKVLEVARRFVESKERRGKKVAKVARKVRDRNVRLAAGGLVVMSMLLSWWRLPVPRALPHSPAGLQVTGLAERRVDHAGWKAEGIIRNDTGATVALAVYHIAYADSGGDVGWQVKLEERDIRAGENRPFALSLPAYTPGMSRGVVPVRFE